jgi:hypothetical protein
MLYIVQYTVVVMVTLFQFLQITTIRYIEILISIQRAVTTKILGNLETEDGNGCQGYLILYPPYIKSYKNILDQKFYWDSPGIWLSVCPKEAYVIPSKRAAHLKRIQTSQSRRS